MTPADAAELLALAAAFDRRTVGQADAMAWGAALHDMPLDPDARAAVARHFSESTEWLTPAHVRSIRHRIRAERLGDTPPAYEPPAHDETGAEYVARRRAQLRAIGDGREKPLAIGAMAGGPAPDVAERLRHMLARVGEMPDHIREQIHHDTAGRIGAAKAAHPELGVECPRAECRARRNQPCHTPAGREMRGHTHDQRQDAYAAALTDQEQPA